MSISPPLSSPSSLSFSLSSLSLSDPRNSKLEESSLSSLFKPLIFFPSALSFIFKNCYNPSPLTTTIHNNIKMYSTQQYPQITERFPYTESIDYSSLSTIVQAFPHLGQINQQVDWSKSNNLTGIIIRSANDDNVHKAIKYGIWTTTVKNRARLNQMFIKAKSEGTDIYLFFTVVKSGMFQGVARLASGLIEDTFPYWWDDFSHKFKDYFKIEWVYIKDVNFYHFDQLKNSEKEDVSSSKDCETLDSLTTQKMLQIFNKKPIKNKWIFNDFAYMDKRELEYTRKNQFPYQQQQMAMDYQSYQMMGGYMGMGTGYGGATNEGTLPLPPQMLKPIGPDTRGDLGFQKNPVSRNRKK